MSGRSTTPTPSATPTPTSPRAGTPRTRRDDGTNMGFVEACGAASMGYWERQDLPFYYSLASHFPIGDRYFAPSWRRPTRTAGSSSPAPRSATSATDGIGISHTDAPNGTIFDRLDNHGICWKDYYPDPDLRALPADLPRQPDQGGPLRAVLRRRRLGQPARVHPGRPLRDYSEEDGDITIGEAYAAPMIDAVLPGPAWENTALIRIYDEHGGWYDHVPPRPAVRPDDVPPGAARRPTSPAPTTTPGSGFPAGLSPRGEEELRLPRPSTTPRS